MTEPEIRDALATSLGEPSVYKSEIINMLILVGPKEVRYCVHKEKLYCTSMFFQGCFQSSMKVSTSNTIKLPEVDPNDFDVILDHMYGQVIRAPAEQGRNHVARLIGAYLLADKLCLEACANSIMNKTQAVA